VEGAVEALVHRRQLSEGDARNALDVEIARIQAGEMGKPREALDRIAGVLMEKKEIFGDELMDLLNSVGLRIPELDYSDEAIWPSPFFAISAPERKPQPKQVEAG
jgi:hypothetical protein